MILNSQQNTTKYIVNAQYIDQPYYLCDNEESFYLALQVCYTDFTGRVMLYLHLLRVQKGCKFVALTARSDSSKY